MDLDSVQKAYSRWSRVYDLVFGPAFTSARRRGIGLLGLRPGHRVLEVGVGTGLSLPLFPADCSIFGIDISRPMLRRARPRAERPGSGLIEGDVAHLPFEDDIFDGVLAPYVISAVPDPVAMLLEVGRVTRPGGRVVLLNHFASEHPLLGALERAVTRTTSRVMGFHADFDVQPALREARLQIERSERVPPFGYWKALRVRGIAS